MIDFAQDATPSTRPLSARLPDAAWRLIAAGTAGYDTETRRGLVIANITGYLASVSSLRPTRASWTRSTASPRSR